MNSVNFTRLFPTESLNRFVLLVFIFLGLSPALLAEGSKDFANYPGRRLFLDTRDNQQMKVFAAAGEFINLGASHIGVSGGFIDVYRPDGTFHQRFDNTENDGTAIIFNNIQEQNGPTGGATGYKPGLIPVSAENAGIWTVVFDFPGDQEGSFTNIDNSAAWTRAVNQPTTQRVVLAWDITVSQNAGGDQGGDLLTGRVYSNKYVSEILGNGNVTSPTFYILSRDGFTYQVDFNDIDPFRFTVGSNSFGIVNGFPEPTYRSVAVGEYVVSSAPDTWTEDQLYLYQLMAEDNGGLINNKVFFNIPAADLPAEAQVTDIFAATPNTHTTWLLNPAEFNPTITFTDFNYVGLNDDGIECNPNTAQTGIGGFAVFDTNLGGTATLELDLNSDGDFDDPIDRRIFDFIEAGTDSVFWDGNDGLGNPLPISEGFTINYNINIRGGEIHIPLIDIENNLGGVSFSLINENGVAEERGFFYDHSQVGGDISGGGTGEPQPTTDPYTYNVDFGDNKIFDFWTYFPFTGDGSGTFTIIISDDCVCNEETTPSIAFESTDYSACEDSGDVILNALNSQANQDIIFYTYFNETGAVVGRDTVSGTQISSLNLGNATLDLNGIYSVVAINDRDCVSDTAMATVTVHPTPVVDSLQSNVSVLCSSDTVTVTGFLSNLSGNYDADVLAPNGELVQPVNIQPAGELTFTLTGLNQSGDYALVVRTPEGCRDTANFNLEILAPPTITSFFQTTQADLCMGDSVVLSAGTNSGGTYSLELPNGDFVNGDLDASNAFSYTIEDIGADNTGEYSLTYTSDNGCGTDVSTLTVAAPFNQTVMNLMGAGPYCEGSEAVVQVTNNNENTGAVSYTFTGPNDFSYTESVADTDTVSLVIPDFQAANAGEYEVIVNAACSTDTLPFLLVLISEVEYSDIQGDETICGGQDFALSASSNLPNNLPVVYTWTGPNDFEFTQTVTGAGPYSANLGNITGAQAGTYTLTLDVPGFTCQNDPLTIDLGVSEAPILENIGGGGSFCENTPVELTASNTNPNISTITYTWIGPDGTEFTETVGADEPLSYSTAGVQFEEEGIWQLVAVADNGCAADTAEVEVDIDPAIVIFNLTGGGSYCEGETITMSANNGNPNVNDVNWSWENSNGIFAQGTVDGTETFSVSLDNVSIQDTGTYVLLLSSDNACPIGVGTFDINIESAPSVAAITGGGTACPGEDVTLVGTNGSENTGPITYTWTGPNGFEVTGTAPSDGEFIAVVPNVGQEEVGTYTLVLSTENGCTIEVPGTTDINLVQTAVPSISSDNELGCDGGTLTLNSTTAEDGSTYTWFFSDEGVITELGETTTPQFIINPFSLSDEGEYFVEVTNSCGDTFSSASISIEAVSGVDAFEDEASTEEDTEVIISVMDNDLMGNNSTFNYEVITAPTNGSAAFNSDATITYTPNAGFTGLDSLQYQICSEACPDICDQAWVYVQVIGLDCFVPNYFTPNGDNDNETFFIDCLENNYPDNELTVYNRWGDIVYSEKGYLNTWDGTLNGEGTELPAGTYFYLLNLTPDGANCLQGYITIVK